VITTSEIIMIIQHTYVGAFLENINLMTCQCRDFLIPQYISSYHIDYNFKCIIHYVQELQYCTVWITFVYKTSPKKSALTSVMAASVELYINFRLTQNIHSNCYKVLKTITLMEFSTACLPDLFCYA